MLINLTPHPITLIGEGGMRINIKPSGTVARVVQDRTTPTTTALPLAPGIDIDVWVQDATNSRVENLPDPQPGTYFIVSTLVAQVAQREDLLAPLIDSTAERDPYGNIAGVRGFRRFLP